MYTVPNKSLVPLSYFVLAKAGITGFRLQALISTLFDSFFQHPAINVKAFDINSKTFIVTIKR